MARRADVLLELPAGDQSRLVREAGFADHAGRGRRLRGAGRPGALPVGARADMTTILVTACGAPGAARLLRSLRENGEREVRLVGVDMSERAIGRHLCDSFHLVPRRRRPHLPRRAARARGAGRCRRRPAGVLARPASPGAQARRVPRAGDDLRPRCRAALERQGRDVGGAAADAASARPTSAA